MLNNEFCQFLEYEISKAFSNSSNEELKHFWCDGVLLPTFDTEYSKEFVNKKKKITLTAYLGVTGQDKYNLTIHFGNKALSKYARGLDISECLPKPEEQDWFSVDIEQLKMEIQLP